MPRKKTQNKIEISKSLEKYNTTLPNNLDSLNNNQTIENINTIQNNTIDNTIDNKLTPELPMNILLSRLGINTKIKQKIDWESPK